MMRDAPRPTGCRTTLELHLTDIRCGHINGHILLVGRRNSATTYFICQPRRGFLEGEAQWPDPRLTSHASELGRGTSAAYLPKAAQFRSENKLASTITASPEVNPMAPPVQSCLGPPDIICQMYYSQCAGMCC